MGKSDKLSKAYNINDICEQRHTLLQNVDVKPTYIMVIRTVRIL